MALRAAFFYRRLGTDRIYSFFSFFGFFIVHMVMILLSGTWNNLRSMITGWYVIRGRKPS